jgi:hypothetical protein
MQSWADFRLVAPPQKVVQQSSGKWEVLPQQPGSLWCFPLFGRRHDQQSDRLLTSFPVCKATGATKARLCLTGKVNIQNPCSGYVVWQSPWTMFLNLCQLIKMFLQSKQALDCQWAYQRMSPGLSYFSENDSTRLRGPWN